MKSSITLSVQFVLVSCLITINAIGQVNDKPSIPHAGDTTAPHRFVQSLSDGLLPKVDSLIQLGSDQIRLQADLQGEPSFSGSLDRHLQEIHEHTARLHHFSHLLEDYTIQFDNPKDISWLEDYLSQLRQLEGVLSQYSGSVLSSIDLKQLESYQQQLQQITSINKGYLEEISNTLSGNFSGESSLMQTLQSKIGLSKEFQELQSQTAELEQFKQIANKYGADYARQQRQQARARLEAKVREIGADAFKEQQPKFQEVHDKFQKLKKKYSGVVDARDLSTAVKRNSLKGQPLSERFVWGGTMQINPSYSRQLNRQTLQESSASVDLSPLIGYRFNKLFTLGLGGIYRAQLDLDELPWESETATYGWRSFLEYQPIESFFLHGEYEAMSTQVAKATSNGEFNQQWVQGGLIGVGKQFPFFNQVKGQVLVLYNFLHEEGVSPYKKPWVIRFGFNIQGLKSKVKDSVNL